MSYSDNIDEVLAWYDENLMPRRGRHTLTLMNVMEYALPLHDKHGYYVLNDEKAAEVVLSWLGELVESGQPVNDTTITKALDGAGYEIIDFLKSLTGQMRPPVRKGQGPRKAHPGGWADVTRNLANAYRHAVNSGALITHSY